MTIGQLSARTGFSAKAIRQFEARGLVYSAGRSPANYRLYDDSALLCLEVITTLRGLSLTLKEIQQLAGIYLGKPNEPIEQHVSDFLDRADERLRQRIAELQKARHRVNEFRTKVAAGEISRLVAADPRRTQRGA